MSAGAAMIATPARTLRQRVLSPRRIPLALALLVVGSLIVASNPSQVGTAIERFHLQDIPIILGLSVGYYVLQGVRWWTLLRLVSTRPPLGDTILMTLTGQATALLPVFLLAVLSVPSVPAKAVTLVLVYSLGLMGVLTPYASGPAPIWYSSGYIPTKDFWRLGAIMGALYLAVLLAVGLPFAIKFLH